MLYRSLNWVLILAKHLKRIKHQLQTNTENKQKYRMSDRKLADGTVVMATNSWIEVISLYSLWNSWNRDYYEESQFLINWTKYYEV